jgi:hypothetical protein
MTKALAAARIASSPRRGFSRIDTAKTKTLSMGPA